MIEIEVLEEEEKDKYPYVGINKEGLIVFFTGRKKGVVMRGTEYFDVGYGGDAWAEELFTPCSIAISSKV